MWKNGWQDRAHEPVDERIDAPLARALRADARDPSHIGVPGAAARRYSCDAMALDRTRTLRGALAGAVAAGVWAAQQPLDKRVFGSRYDDVELLGKAVAARRRRWLRRSASRCTCATARCSAPSTPNVAPRCPLPAGARGPARRRWPSTSALWPLAGVSRPLASRARRAARAGRQPRALRPGHLAPRCSSASCSASSSGG